MMHTIKHLPLGPVGYEFMLLVEGTTATLVTLRHGEVEEARVLVTSQKMWVRDDMMKHADDLTEGNR